MTEHMAGLRRLLRDRSDVIVSSQTYPVPEPLPELIVADADAWRRWLSAHQSDAPGVLLVLAKKGVTEPTALTYAQALEEALCHGWIDGQVGRRDELTYRQRFTPRRARSKWSQRNVGLVAKLTDEGRMRPPGLAAVQSAKDDGRWDDAYPAQSTIEVPDDLAAALATAPRAKAMFDLLTSQNRYAVLYRVHDAKRADTRARRIQSLVAMLARGETVHPQRRKPSA
jgi:uncharacterized protein YdeI (YjbR/CyaY-like superfamily)